MTYNPNILDLEEEMREYLKGEDFFDPAFRFSILMSQIGSLASHYNHDPKVNPSARSYKTRDGEISDFGHALLQLIVYGISREIPIGNSLDIASRSLAERDWKSKEDNTNEIREAIDRGINGMCASRGSVRGKTFVDMDCSRLSDMPKNSILITSHPSCSQITPHLGKMRAIITRDGGFTCHAAIVAREFKIPCVVGVGKYIDLIPDGANAHLDTDTWEMLTWESD